MASASARSRARRSAPAWVPARIIFRATNRRGRSWLAGKPGFKIGSPLVTIRDGGQVPRAPGSIPFDGEGVDTTDVALVSRGAVTGQTVDLATSARTGIAPTGNAMRGGYEGLPNIASRNLYLEPGASSPAEILSGVKEGLWVWSLTGWWIGLDPSNPEFSSAAAGVWIEWGKPVKPVARVTIAARLSDLFGNVDAVGNDLVFDDGAKTPSYRVSEMSISGS